MTTNSVSQAGVEYLYKVIPGAVASQAGIEYLHRVQPGAVVSQVGIEYLHRVQPTFAISQVGVEYLHKHVPCTTRWAQIWTITRTDDEVYRFTSLDRDLEFGGHTYQACDSLVPSASEAVSEADAAGTMDLSGAIGPDGITERDLFGGKFDGATVDAWLVPWSGKESPKPLLTGTFGRVEQSETGFKVEILGDGAKLTQTPLISLIQPGCRWLAQKYGGFGGSFCGKDLTALTVTGTVDSATGQRAFVDAARAETAGYFTRGKVTFTTGNNAGVSAEIKEHAAGGSFELWPRLAFPVLAGDEYSMTPGCTGLHEASGGTNGCEAWDNKRRFGGFRKVPGGDKRSAAANVR
jgi:uncharacterized phage protein (TIGR02218 family)